MFKLDPKLSRKVKSKVRWRALGLVLIALASCVFWAAAGYIYAQGDNFFWMALLVGLIIALLLFPEGVRRQMCSISDYNKTRALREMIGGPKFHLAEQEDEGT